MDSYIFSLISVLTILPVNVECQTLEANTTYRTSDGSVAFGLLTSFWSAGTASYPPQHLDTDFVFFDHLLISDRHRLLAVRNGDYKLVAGVADGYLEGSLTRAKFGWISGFLRITKWQILVVDSYNHCIRLVDRYSRCVSEFVGKCLTSGYDDGVGTQARFDRPTGIVLDRVEQYYVYISDTNNNAIRQVNINTKYVKGISREFTNPGQLIWDRVNSGYSSRSFLVVDRTVVKRFDIAAMSVSTMFGGSEGSRDGDLSVARFGDIKDIQMVHTSGLYIVSDSRNNRLRLVDMRNRKVHSLCLNRIDRNETQYHCEVRNASGLYFVNDTLYVGMTYAVKALDVRSIGGFNLSRVRAPAYGDSDSRFELRCDGGSFSTSSRGNWTWATTTAEKSTSWYDGTKNYWSTRPVANHIADSYSSYQSSSNGGLIGIVVGAVLGTAVLIALVILIVLLSYRQCTRSNSNPTDVQIRYQTSEENATIGCYQPHQNQGQGWATTDLPVMQMEPQQYFTNAVPATSADLPALANTEGVLGAMWASTDSPATQHLPGELSLQVENFIPTTSTASPATLGQGNTDPVYYAVCDAPNQAGYETTGYPEETGTVAHSDGYVLPHVQQEQLDSFSNTSNITATPESFFQTAGTQHQLM